MDELDKKKVKKDLEKWAAKLREADQAIREIYMEMNDIYRKVLE